MSSTKKPAGSAWTELLHMLGKSPGRRMLRFVMVVGIAYLVVLVLLLLLENKFLYHPYRDSDSWMPPPVGMKAEDVWLTLADGTRIHGWWCPVDGATGAVLYAHGNAGNLSHRGQAAGKLQEALGLSVLLFDYPGYGKSDGSPSEAGCYAAADAAYEWLARQVPADQIVLYGKSLGGAVMTDLAIRRPHQALVLCKTFTSVPDMAQKTFPFLPARWLVTNRFESIAKIGQCPRPILIAQADRDSLIPFVQGQRLYEAAPEPKKFFILAGCDHNDAHPVEFYSALAEFLRSIP